MAEPSPWLVGTKVRLINNDDGYHRFRVGSLGQVVGNSYRATSEYAWMVRVKFDDYEEAPTVYSWRLELLGELAYLAIRAEKEKGDGEATE